MASNVIISGIEKVGQTMSGSYDYSDHENDLQGVSTFKWYRADSSTGTNKTIIDGAVLQTYTVTSDDLAKYIFFEVTPTASVGALIGASVQSAATLAIEETDTTAPDPIVLKQTVLSGGEVNVQSTEIGTAYLVPSTIATSSIDTVSKLENWVSTSSNKYTKVEIKKASTLTSMIAPATDGKYSLVVVDAMGNVSEKSENLITVSTNAISGTVQPFWSPNHGTYSINTTRSLKFDWRTYVEVTNGYLLIELEGATVNPEILTSSYGYMGGAKTPITSSMLSNNNTLLTLPIPESEFGSWQTVTINGALISSTPGTYSIKFRLDQDGDGSSYLIGNPTKVDLVLE